METTEKQQIIEAIKTLIKARWFFASIVFIQGLILKFFKISIPLASFYQLFFILLFVYFYNFIFWLYLRNPIEKINNFLLKIIKNLQLFLDLIAISGILYLSGTVDKMVTVFFIVVLMLSISIYDKKGIFLIVFIILICYYSLVLLEYYNLLPPAEEAKYFISARNNLDVLKLRLIGFGSYIIASGFFAWFLGDLFRKREKTLVLQKDDLLEKTKVLDNKTKELLKTQQELQLALQKSEISKKAALRAREEMEKANLELKKKIEELEKFYKITVGREVKMVELKERIKELEEKLKEKNNL